MESSCFVSSVSRPTLSSSAVWTGCHLRPSRPQGAVAVLGTDVDARKVSAKATGGKGVLTHARAALTLATVRACLFWLFSLLQLFLPPRETTALLVGSMDSDKRSPPRQ